MSKALRTWLDLIYGLLQALDELVANHYRGKSIRGKFGVIKLYITLLGAQ